MATGSEHLDDEGVVPLLEAGESAKGEFRCAACGYGAAVHGELPSCPMCRGTTWESTDWRPFTRAADARAVDELLTHFRL